MDIKTAIAELTERRDLSEADMEAVVRRSFSSENATARHALHLIAEARHYVESAQYAITEAAR